jgi:YhcH/YjgK/YiaL family protein
MIFGHIAHLQDLLPAVPPALRTALSHLRDTDFAALPAGNYDLQGKDIYVQVIDMVTRPVTDCRPEVHRDYADVQFLVRGAERIGIAVDSGDNEISEDFARGRDLRFYKNVRSETTLTMRPGSFAVFLPSDVHAPGGAVDAPEAIRKVVIKVRVSLLK